MNSVIRKHGITGAELNYPIAIDTRILRLTPGNDVVAVDAKSAKELRAHFKGLGWQSVDVMTPRVAKKYGW